MNEYVDFWNLMAYDYSGSWNTIAGHDANVYASISRKPETIFSSKSSDFSLEEE